MSMRGRITQRALSGVRRRTPVLGGGLDALRIKPVELNRPPLWGLYRGRAAASLESVDQEPPGRGSRAGGRGFTSPGARSARLGGEPGAAIDATGARHEGGDG